MRYRWFYTSIAEIGENLTAPDTSGDFRRSPQSVCVAGLNDTCRLGADRSTQLPMNCNNEVGWLIALVMTSRFFIPKRISRVLTGPYRFQWDSLKGFHIRLRRQGRKKAAEIASASTTQVRRFTGLCEAFCRQSEYSYFELLSCFLLQFFPTCAYSLRFLAMKALNYNCRGFLNIIWIWRWGELVPWDTCKLSLKLIPGIYQGEKRNYSEVFHEKLEGLH